MPSIKWVDKHGKALDEQEARFAAWRLRLARAAAAWALQDDRRPSDPWLDMNGNAVRDFNDDNNLPNPNEENEPEISLETFENHLSGPLNELENLIKEYEDSCQQISDLAQAVEEAGNTVQTEIKSVTLKDPTRTPKYQYHWNIPAQSYPCETARPDPQEQKLVVFTRPEFVDAYKGVHETNEGGGKFTPPTPKDFPRGCRTGIQVDGYKIIDSGDPIIPPQAELKASARTEIKAIASAKFDKKVYQKSTKTIVTKEKTLTFEGEVLTERSDMGSKVDKNRVKEQIKGMGGKVDGGLSGADMKAIANDANALKTKGDRALKNIQEERSYKIKADIGKIAKQLFSQTNGQSREKRNAAGERISELTGFEYIPLSDHASLLGGGGKFKAGKGNAEDNSEVANLIRDTGAFDINENCLQESVGALQGINERAEDKKNHEGSLTFEKQYGFQNVS